MCSFQPIAEVQDCLYEKWILIGREKRRREDSFDIFVHLFDWAESKIDNEKRKDDIGKLRRDSHAQNDD